MRDYDDAPYVVYERDRGGIGSFFLGALVGAGLALLFAPQSGEETQEDIRERARSLRDAAEARMREAQQNLEDRIDEARGAAEARVAHVREAVDSGRRAAQDARVELERRLERSKAAYRAGIEAAREEAKNESSGATQATTPTGEDEAAEG